MPFYFYIYILLFLAIVSIAVLYFFSRRTSLSRQLFIKGIRAENNGLYEEATSSYEKALREMKNERFHHQLGQQIKGKLKVLRNLSNYNRDQGFIRVNNSWVA